MRGITGKIVVVVLAAAFWCASGPAVPVRAAEAAPAETSAVSAGADGDSTDAVNVIQIGGGSTVSTAASDAAEGDVSSADGSASSTVTEGYGDNAYVFASTLQSSYPVRAMNYPNLDAARDWLTQTVTTLGFAPQLQHFEIAVPEKGWNLIGDNIIFSKQGAVDSSKVIVVGAHYDTVGTNGADDNASGVGVLLELASRVSAGSYPYTVRFVLFSAEEPGVYGSRYYVQNLSEEDRNSILCMINLDAVGAGDNMYLYGGGLDDNDNIVRTWLYDQALADAKQLGLAMSTHPDVNASFPAPTKTTDSDQQYFNEIGIPYLYCEASNWNGGSYNNFYQTDNPAVENGKIMHVEAYDNLAFINATFGTRYADHLKAYSCLLDDLLKNLTPDSSDASAGPAGDAGETEPESEEESGSDAEEETERDLTEESSGTAEETSAFDSAAEASPGVSGQDAESTAPESEAVTEAPAGSQNVSSAAASSAANTGTAASNLHRFNAAENFTFWLQNNPSAKFIAAAGVILLAVILCLIVFIIRLLRK